MAEDEFLPFLQDASRNCEYTAPMEKVLLHLLGLLPTNALSRGVGGILRAPWPRSVHQAAIGAFVHALEVNVEEAERDLSDYDTFTDFFTRRLRDGARPIDRSSDFIVSPCDGTLGTCGRVTDGMLLQAKGRPYSLADLLGGVASSRRYEGGDYLTIYLAPSDYHRVHFPVDGEVTESHHLPGRLWPVNPPAVEHVSDLFAVNERLVTHMDTAAGSVAVVMVGATCVGRIRMLYDEGVTNLGADLGRKDYRPPITVAKGDELGVFEMGSTVILVTGPGGCEFDESIGASGTGGTEPTGKRRPSDSPEGWSARIGLRSSREPGGKLRMGMPIARMNEGS